MILDELSPRALALLKTVKNEEDLLRVLSDFEVKNPRSAGIDIGSMLHYVAVPPHISKENVRHFGGFTKDLESLGDWLVSLKISSVVMESTGNYWQSLYEVLEARGIQVCLVNARHAKNVSGRKSDVLDCQWLLQLHTYGLLSASFIPEEEIRVLRTYLRQRGYFEDYKARSLQAIHKALTSMNIKTQHIISDVEGVHAQKLIRAIASGQHDVEVLAQFHSKQMKASIDQFKASLRGNYRKEHIFILQQALSSYDFYVSKMRECEEVIERQLLQLQCSLAPQKSASSEDSFVSKQKKKKVRKNQYAFDVKHYLIELLGVDLTEIEGLDENSILEILSETSTDLSKWKSAGHFVSWLRLCPNPQISGGKVIRNKKLKTTNRASTAFRLAARSLHSAKGYLGKFYRHLSHRKGPAVAIKAVARKLAIIFYNMVTKKCPYKKTDHADYEQKYKEKIMKNIKRNAEKMGFKIEIVSV